MLPVNSDEAEREAIEAAHLRNIRERDNQRYQKLRRDAQASYRAFEGWPRIRTPEDWANLVAESQRDYESGKFLIERLGGERFVDPAMMATLLGLRQSLLAELDRPATAECMLIDAAVLAFFNLSRVQGWLGNLSLDLERDFFRQPALPAPLGGQSGPDVLAVEERLKRIGEQLLPLFDRTHKALIRALKAVRENRRGPAPSVAINTASHVNIGQEQTNTVVR
jgi:hypothetical protein